jgi:hypothetical protein
MTDIHKKGDKVKYEDDEYIVTFVWNHGGNMVYYDLEAESGLLGTGYKQIPMSVHHSEVQEVESV